MTEHKDIVLAPSGIQDSETGYRAKSKIQIRVSFGDGGVDVSWRHDMLRSRSITEWARIVDLFGVTRKTIGATHRVSLGSGQTPREYLAEHNQQLPRLPAGTDGTVGCVSNGNVRAAALLFDAVLVPAGEITELFPDGQLPEKLNTIIHADYDATEFALDSMMHGITTVTEQVAGNPGYLDELGLPFSMDLGDHIEKGIKIPTFRDLSGVDERQLSIEHVYALAFEYRFQLQAMGTHTNAVALWNTSLSTRLASEFVHDPLADPNLWSAVLSHVPIAVEDTLDWDQVVDFRTDEGSRRKYVAFKNWLRDCIASKSTHEARERIEERLFDYKSALKKHGVQTRLGTLTAIASPSSFLGVSGGTMLGVPIALAHEPLAAFLLGLSGYLGGVGIELYRLKSTMLERDRIEGREVAYLHELQEAVDRGDTQ